MRIDITVLPLAGPGWALRPAARALQDLTFESLEGRRVLRAGSAEFPGRSADDAQLRRLTPTVAAQKQMQPDREPFSPPRLSKVITRDLTCDVLTAGHQATPLHPWFPGTPGDGSAPDTGVLLS